MFAALLLSTAAHAAGWEPSAPYGKTTDITGPDGLCIAVTNNSPTHPALMVPSKTEYEWRQFISTTYPNSNRGPAGVSIADCGCLATTVTLHDTGAGTLHVPAIGDNATYTVTFPGYSYSQCTSWFFAWCTGTTTYTRPKFPVTLQCRSKNVFIASTDYATTLSGGVKTGIFNQNDYTKLGYMASWGGGGGSTVSGGPVGMSTTGGNGGGGTSFDPVVTVP